MFFPFSIGEFAGDARGAGAGAAQRTGGLLLAMLLCAPSTHAAIPALSISARQLEYAGTQLENPRFEIDAAGDFKAGFERLRGAGETVFGDGLSLRGRLLSLENQPESLNAAALVEVAGLVGQLALERGSRQSRLQWVGTDQALTALAAVPGMPQSAAWVTGGRFDAQLALSLPSDAAASVDLKMQLRDAVFDSPDGLYAGQGLGLDVQLGWADVARASLSLQGALKTGELLAGDFYRDFSGGALDYSGLLSWSELGLLADRLVLSDDHAVRFEGRLGLPAGPVSEEKPETAPPGSSWTLEVDRLELAFPEAYRRYIEPAAAALTLDGLEVTGRLLWSGEWQDGNLLHGDLQVSDLSVVDRERERFAATGIEAHLRPGDHAFASRLAWRGLLFGPINLGAGAVALDSEPGTIALLQPLELDVLGGRVDLETFRLTLPGSRADGVGEPDLALKADIDRLDMRQLSSLLGWPEFAGTLSGEIPGVSLNDGVLAIDGQVRLDVFGGRILLRQLGVERLFGVLPSLAADVAVENLDLEQLTGTFSFGQIAGRLDGYVRDLRMLDWRPVAFDAWLGTPAGQSGSRDISRQAVNRLTTIGGGGATTALTSPLMRMFSTFSYRRLGLGCRLQNNVCTLRGLSEDDSSVLILEGAGVPKITIRAFNRSIDWPQMVSNLLAISADNPVRLDAGPGRSGK